ncbi:hypothetical protein [Bacteroides sp. UBA939]|uniref:hypothetical protein n=1 Tax=Bacteroides sp. UBA939 TaxID=1946092 RepID=UPI0025BC7184|nr:hypothetical protein [Bacteroides sp. UBA939]
MKKSIALLTLLFVVSLSVAAQETIHFVAGVPAQKGLNQKNKDALKLKVEQILARNNAGVASLYNAFVIQPELVLGETRKTEGLLRDVTLVTGEFSLTARNKYDDSVYGTAVIEVQGDATGSTDDAIASLISSIKVTDPAFVRFIRNTRKHITEFYQQNCPIIIEKARVMIDAGMLREAGAYLSVVPETVPCYGDILKMLQEIGQQEPQETPVATEPTPELVSPEPVAEVPPVAVSEPVPAPAPVAAQPEQTPLPEYKAAVSCNNLTFELVSCEGNETAGTIRMHVRFRNTGATNNNAAIRMGLAIDPDGATFTEIMQVAEKGCTTSTYGNKMPKGIRIGKVFEIKGVNSPCAILSYAEMAVDNCKVILHNIPVNWK